MPILEKALQGPDLDVSLRQAFDRIKQLGAQGDYQEGLENFKEFMEEVFSYHNLVENDYARELIIELALQTFAIGKEEMQAALKVIDSRPEWKREYDQFHRQVVQENEQNVLPVIQVFSGDQLIGQMSFYETPDRKSLDEISPGNYLLKLHTGVVLWEGELTAGDLICRRLEMAAETDEVKRQPTKQIELWHGEVILRVFAGIESGSIEVELTK